MPLLAIAADEITQAAAAPGDRIGERRPDRCGKRFTPRTRQAAGARAGRNPRSKQALRGIDVADADHLTTGEKHLLDRQAATATGPIEKRPVERGREGLSPQLRKERVKGQVARVGIVPEQGAKAPGIGEPQDAGRSLDIDMIMAPWGISPAQQPKLARHTQMHDQRSSFAPEKQIFAPPANRLDRLIPHQGGELGLNRPAQTGLAHRDGTHARPNNPGL